MEIRNDTELIAVVREVGEKLQSIQNYVGHENSASGKIRFPRGFIRTAGYFRLKLSFISDRNARDNLAYALILSDVYRWLTNRTDLFGTAREMIIKAGIVLVGSIIETIMFEYTRGVIGRRHSFCARADRMVAKEMISASLAEELKWVWAARGGIHIYEINEREYERYSVTDYNRAIRTLRSLREGLELHHIGF